jgi:hypothetical protein
MVAGMAIEALLAFSSALYVQTTAATTSSMPTDRPPRIGSLAFYPRDATQVKSRIFTSTEPTALLLLAKALEAVMETKEEK